jgi:hypothetical protein
MAQSTIAQSARTTARRRRKFNVARVGFVPAPATPEKLVAESSKSSNS